MKNRKLKQQALNEWDGQDIKDLWAKFDEIDLKFP